MNRRSSTRRCRPIALFLAALAAATTGLAQEHTQTTTAPAAPASRPAIFDAGADAKAQLAAALAAAKRENQRVLVMFGGNWCGWCHRLHALFQENQDIARTLLYEYRLVLVDVGRFDKNLDVAGGYGVELKKSGVPFLTVLDSEGKVLANQETGSLETETAHDPQKVLAFLDKWKAAPQDAEAVLADGLARATRDHKLVFLRLGAPRCPWCHKLEDFLANPEVAQILGLDFVDVKIDVDRMKNGKEVAGRFRPSDKAGIPWFAFLAADGTTLATSDGPDGNIGYPVQPAEIEHFLSMLKKTTRRVSADQVGRIEKLLRAAAESIPADRRG